MKELIEIQKELKAPKSQTNTFGKYKYRSLEDILEALKPIIAKNKCFILITDSIELVGERYYVKATATLYNDEGQSVTASAYAREDVDKKGMDLSQLTGATSSYARKFALNGLFAIDDSADSDSTNDISADQKNHSRTINESEMSQLNKLIGATNTDIEKFCAAYKIGSLSEMKLPEFQNAIKLLKAKQAKAQQ